MSEENKRVVRRYFEELDRRKGTPVDLCADRFTFYVAGFPPMDLEATKQLYGRDKSAGHLAVAR
jgi:hypothetical protein